MREATHHEREISLVYRLTASGLLISIVSKIFGRLASVVEKSCPAPRYSWRRFNFKSHARGYTLRDRSRVSSRVRACAAFSCVCACPAFSRARACDPKLSLL